MQADLESDGAIGQHLSLWRVKSSIHTIRHIDFKSFHSLDLLINPRSRFHPLKGRSKLSQHLLCLPRIKTPSSSWQCDLMMQSIVTSMKFKFKLVAFSRGWLNLINSQTVMQPARIQVHPRIYDEGSWPQAIPLPAHHVYIQVRGHPQDAWQLSCMRIQSHPRALYWVDAMQSVHYPSSWSFTELKNAYYVKNTLLSNLDGYAFGLETPKSYLQYTHVLNINGEGHGLMWNFLKAAGIFDVALQLTLIALNLKSQRSKYYIPLQIHINSPLGLLHSRLWDGFGE